MKDILSCAALIVLTGCSNLNGPLTNAERLSFSAMQTGCLPSAVRISDQDDDLSSRQISSSKVIPDIERSTYYFWHVHCPNDNAAGERLFFCVWQEITRDLGSPGPKYCEELRMNSAS